MPYSSVLERASGTHKYSVQLKLGLLTSTCSVVCLLPQAYSNKLRLAALEVPGFISLWCLGAQREGMVINMENVKDTLRNYILEHFQIEADDPDFGDDVHLFDYGFVDSLGATEIVLFLEETFHIQITQKDITLYPMNTIDEITEVVENKLKG